MRFFVLLRGEGSANIRIEFNLTESALIDFGFFFNKWPKYTHSDANVAGCSTLEPTPWKKSFLPVLNTWY